MCNNKTRENICGKFKAALLPVLKMIHMNQTVDNDSFEKTGEFLVLEGLDIVVDFAVFGR